jgi:hypothetical protein
MRITIAQRALTQQIRQMESLSPEISDDEIEFRLISLPANYLST